MLAIKSKRLIDGTGTVLHGGVLLIEGERIRAVGPAEEVRIPPDAALLDAGAKTVMPGMIDAHLHLSGSGVPGDSEAWGKGAPGAMALRSYIHARKHLEAGFTAVRDAGSFGYVDVAVRDEIDAGLLVGPRLRVCGQGLTPTGGHADISKGFSEAFTLRGQTNIADSPDGARKAARYQIKMGADFIKISASLSDEMQEMSLAMMAAICEVAHATLRRVAVHCSGGCAVTDALAAGVDSLEHGRFLSDAHLETMVRQGVYLVPTLSPEARMMQNDPKALGFTDRSIKWMLHANEIMYDTVGRAHKMGVKVAVGSDAAMPAVYHGESAFEIELLTKAGMTPMEAIVAATRTGAEVLDMAADIGTLEPGKLADLVILDGDPLADIRVLQDVSRIKKVLKGGEIVVDRE